MRVTFKSEGGVAYFPRLAKPTVIDTAKLPAEQAEALTTLVSAARFFELPSTVPTTGADRRCYVITIEDGARRHTVSVAEPVQDPNLAALIEHLKALARAQRGK